jgi:hypothetical protein
MWACVLMLVVGGDPRPVASGIVPGHWRLRPEHRLCAAPKPMPKTSEDS